MQAAPVETACGWINYHPTNITDIFTLMHLSTSIYFDNDGDSCLNWNNIDDSPFVNKGY